MAFPAFGTPSTGTGGNLTSHTITLPASVPAGATIFLNFSFDNAGTASLGTEAGTFVQLFRSTSTGTMTHEVWYKLNASGTEGGVGVSLTLSVAGELAYQAVAITGVDTSTAPEASAATVSTSDSPDPAIVTPSWGLADTLYIAVVGINTTSSSPTVSAYPSNYTGNNSNITQSAASGVGIAWATRELAATSDDPGVFTLTASAVWHARTVAIRPASASATLTDVDGDEVITTGQTSVSYTGTNLTDADGLVVTFASREAAATAFVATNATSGTFTAPSLSAVLASGVKFGTVTFQIEDGGVSLATLGGGTLNPESGWVVHNVTDTSQATDPGCIYFGQSPAIESGDQILFESNGSNVTIDSQGFVTLDGVTSFSYYIWDDTDDTWGSVGLFSGAGGAANNIWQYLYEAGTSGGIMRRMKNFLNGLGYTGNTNKMLFNWLRANGYTRTLTGMLTKFERDNTNRYG